MIFRKETTMKQYITPDFDVTVYEISDEFTASPSELEFGKDDPNGNDDDWWG